MSDQLPTFPEATSPDSSSVISSQASEAGLSRSDSPAGLTTDPSGLVLVPVSPTLQRADDRAIATLEIFGLISDDSSPSGSLQRSLENRLRQRMAAYGSPEYTLTWKHWRINSRLRISALRASGLPTSGKGCTGWATPTSRDHKDGEYRPETAPINSLLGRQASLAGWSTPTAEDHRRGDLPARPWDTGIPLSQQAPLAGWATPRSTESGHSTGNLDRAENHKSRLEDQVYLTGQASLENAAGWATPAAKEAGGTPEQFLDRKRRAMENGASLGVSLTSLSLQAEGLASGLTAHGSDAPMERSAGFRLNPEFSRWLMGYPAAWGFCGALAMRSLRRSRLNSSSQPKRRSET
jgi:hypothetical protein